MKILLFNSLQLEGTISRDFRLTILLFNSLKLEGTISRDLRVKILLFNVLKLEGTISQDFDHVKNLVTESLKVKTIG